MPCLPLSPHRRAVRPGLALCAPKIAARSSLALASLLSMSCHEAEFASATPKRTEAALVHPQEVPDQSLMLTSLCEDPTERRQEVAPAADGSSVSARLSGQWCRATDDALTILFVVDHSGSMGRHVDQTSGVLQPGNDPWVSSGGAASCGRLEAARSIVARTREQLAALPKAARAKVEVGLLAFASRSFGEQELLPMSLEELDSKLTAEVFCRYVVQKASDLGAENPGGILPRGVAASTNYAAAFQRADAIVSGRSGRKLVYFISDGQATAGGWDPARAGIAAAQALRQRPNVTLNGLLLGNVAEREEEVFREVVGDAEKVRLVAQASDLAKAILELPSQDLKASDLSLSLLVDGLAAQELALEDFAKVDAASGVWRFTSAPFVLEAGKTATLSLGMRSELGGLEQKRELHVDVGGL